MEAKYCHIYLREGRIIIISQAQTKAGFFIEKEPVYAIETATLFEEIGKATKKALNNFIENEPTPGKFSLSDYVGLAYAKVKSYKSFIAGTKLLSVSLQNNEYSLQPTINGGYSGENKGFHSDNKKIKIPKEVTDLELGKKIVSSLELSQC